MRSRVRDLSQVPVATALGLLAAVSLVPLGVLASVALNRSEDAVVEEVDRRMRSTVQASARSVQSEMHGLRSLVQSYARDPSLVAALGDETRPRDLRAIRARLEELRWTEDGIALVFIVDRNGVYIDGLPDTPSIVGESFSHRDWYRGVMATSAPYVSAVYESAISGQPLVTAAAAPVRGFSGGEATTVAVLVAAFKLERLDRHAESVAAPEGLQLVVTDQRGQVVAARDRPSDRIVSVAGDARVEAALRGDSGGGQTRVEGQTVLSAHSPVPSLGWAVVADVPRSTALAPLGGMRSTLIALSGLLVAAICSALLLSARALRQRRVFMAELADAHREALAAASVKSEFLATMSHEIRTPMNGVLGLLGVLRSTELNEDQTQLVQTAESSATALLAIIDDVLDFSRIDAARLELEEAPIDLRLLLDEVRSLLASQTMDKGLDFTVHVGDEVPRLIGGDPGRLRQVVLNLAGNAVKFTAEGSVAITAGRRDGQLEIEVTDTGIGMTQETIGRLFDSFSQADRSTTRLYGGSGLGLAISRRLVELMGGSIGVASEPGQGSRFWVTLPLREATGPSTRPEVEAVAIRVLVVDDQPTNREMLEQTLTGWGMQPAVCDSGDAALALLRRAAEERRPFHVVLIDHEMDGMDGVHLAQLISNDSVLAGTHLLLLSSSNRSIDPRAARRAGIATWLTKPVRASALYDAITAGVHSRPARQPERRQPAGLLRTDRTLQVLVADDNTVNQQVATRMLELRGFHVDVVADGQTAIEAAGAADYDAILMDCQMPGVDGFEATMAIRASGLPRSQVPIIALSAGAMEVDAAKSLAAGMDAHITKPVAWDEVARLIRELADGSAPEPPMAASSGSDVLDRSSLDELRAMGGDEQVDRLIATFLSSTAARLAEAGEAVAAGDDVRLAALCHGIRGAASTFGAHELARITMMLERGVDAPAEQQMVTMERMLAAFDEVRVQLERDADRSRLSAMDRDDERA